MDIIQDRIMDYLEQSGYCDSEVIEFYEELLEWVAARIRVMKGE